MGFSETAAGEQHGFFAEDGAMTDLGPINPLGYSDLINARGQVLVNHFAGGKLQAAIWDHGKTTGLPTLGGNRVEAAAINDAGEVAGASSVATGESHAFLWDNGVMTDLGTLDRTISSATAINEAGEVAGVSEMAGGAAHAFLWENGVMTDLGTLNGANSTATAINDAGDVTGSAATGDGNAHAVLWLRGGKGQRRYLGQIMR